MSVDTLLAMTGPCQQRPTCWRSEMARSDSIPPVAYSTNFQMGDVTGVRLGLFGSTPASPLPSSTGDRRGPARAGPLFLEERKVGGRAPALDHDQQGFWERNGYHNHGDPWLEQRYDGD